MKIVNKIYILIFLIISLFSCENILADNILRVAIKDSCNVRVGPGVQNNKIAIVSKGGLYNMVSDIKYKDTNTNKNCNDGWYEIYYNGAAKGYICSDHAEVIASYIKDDVEPTSDCEKNFSSLGFPSSYWGGLCNLKSKHSNWNFLPKKINLNWQDVVEEESPCGWNLIYGSDANDKFIDKTCKAYDSGYVGVLPQGIAYYMDPRNFLSERFIFQFQNLGYENKLKDFYINGSKSILSSAMFYNYHLEKGTDFSILIDLLGSELGVSPMFISSRMLQELGRKDSLYNLYSGVYEGNNKEYYGYYNFYNYGVSDSCVQEFGTTFCGLNFAKKNSWNTVENAIKGGMQKISNNYIKENQYTTYYQKFNVIGRRPFTHQYQTNVAGPSSESAITYKAYSDLGIIDANFNFEIPVYKNMDVIVSNSNSGAIEDEEETNSKPSTIPISTIVTSSGYRYSSKYISNIKPGTEIKLLKGVIESGGGNSTILITNKEGQEVKDGYVGTGYKISINNQETTEVLEAVIKGDTSGDGVINALDLLEVQKNILGTYKLTGANASAGDTSGDGIINALDLLQIQKSILGTYEIKQ